MQLVILNNDTLQVTIQFQRSVQENSFTHAQREFYRKPTIHNYMAQIKKQRSQQIYFHRKLKV